MSRDQEWVQELERLTRTNAFLLAKLKEATKALHRERESSKAMHASWGFALRSGWYATEAMLHNFVKLNRRLDVEQWKRNHELALSYINTALEQWAEGEFSVPDGLGPDEARA